MTVEITISQVIEKMRKLRDRNDIMYLPELRTRVARSITYLETSHNFLKNLKDGQGNPSKINGWKTKLREAVYNTENDIDSFLVRTALNKASPILYVTSLSDQVSLNKKMEKIVDELKNMSEQTPSAFKAGGEDTSEPSVPEGQSDQEQAKPSANMGASSSNNLGDPHLQPLAKSKTFVEDTSQPIISNGRPESDQEQPKLPEDTGVQPTDLSSNNLGVSQLRQLEFKDVGEIISEPNISDGRPDQEPTDLSRNLGDGKLDSKDNVEDTPEQIFSKDIVAPPTDLSIRKDLPVIKNNEVADRIAGDFRNRKIQRLPSIYDETKIVVLDDKVRELTQLTLNLYDMYFLISVVGRAGSGKTLLVRQIFNQSQTRQNFDKLAFISVSQNFKERDILAEILQQVAGVKDQEKLSFEVLQQKLHDFLARKRYLIVLDDVHTPDVWNKIKLAFPKSKGSRVILTIRDANVARRISPTIVLLHLRPLTNEESWKLFLTRVKMKEDIRTLPDSIKQEILHKCQGLPLQILVLGGLLASKDFTPDEWSKVLNQIKVIGKDQEKKTVEETKPRRKETVTAQRQRPEQVEIQAADAIGQKKQEEKETSEAPDEDQSNSPDQSDSLDPSNILDLAFEDLSSNLKECFHYLCLFPKSCEIRTRRLFQLWFAEGLAGDSKAAEDVVEGYIADLKQRNMIEVPKLRSDGMPKKCRVVDTLHDRYISDAADLGYHHIHGKSDSPSKSPKSNIRRFAERLDPHDHDKHDLNQKGCFYDHDKRDVRSYICFYNQKGDRPAEEVEKFIKNTFNGRGFGLLTMLDLESVYKPVLPKTLGKVLPLLKYVGLRWTFLDSIPESVGDLQFLETLDVKHTNITTLPISIWKAKELQHLYMNEIHFEMSNRESSSCEKLQTLWGLLIRNRNPPIELLKKLTSIRKLGLTCHTESLKKLTEWISGLDGLRSLRLRAINEFIKPSGIHLGSMFKHNKELTDLYLLGELPKAIDQIELPPKLTNLTLSVSQLSDDPMEMLGQLKELKVLKLLARSYIGKGMTCLQGGFPKLEVLKLWMLKELEKWIIEEGTMPELKELEIRYCPKLNKPEGLENLTAATAALEKVTLTNMNEAFITVVEGCLGQKVSIHKTNHVFNPSWN